MYVHAGPFQTVGAFVLSIKPYITDSPHWSSQPIHHERLDSHSKSLSSRHTIFVGIHSIHEKFFTKGFISIEGLSTETFWVRPPKKLKDYDFEFRDSSPKISKGFLLSSSMFNLWWEKAIYLVTINVHIQVIPTKPTHKGHPNPHHAWHWVARAVQSSGHFAKVCRKTFSASSRSADRNKSFSSLEIWLLCVFFPRIQGYHITIMYCNPCVKVFLWITH